MSLGFLEERQRRRQNLRRTIIRWILGLVLVVILGVEAYNTGSDLAQGEVVQLDEQIAGLNKRIAILERKLADEQVTVSAERSKAGEWRRRYEASVPAKRIVAMMDLVSTQLQAGVDESRLTFLINSAQNPRTCDNKPKTKRFIAQTPFYKGANDSVGFHNNTVTVTAVGEAAVNAAGQPEGWYDPAKPVTLRVAIIGGEISEKAGKLPLQHAVVVGKNEFLLSAVAGAKGFVKVTADRCDYP
jgi:hypothetical protein